NGMISAYVGEGALTNDPLDTFGHRAVAHVPQLQDLMRFICRNGFEHHVAMTMGEVAGVLEEAFENYLGWDVYRHAC
ncbi:MAG: fucose isomerase, partial [Chloroflexota bacterium]